MIFLINEDVAFTFNFESWQRHSLREAFAQVCEQRDKLGLFLCTYILQHDVILKL
jgi:hypothetical protein